MFLHYLISQHYRSKTIVQHQRYYVYSVEKLAKREGNRHELCINLIIALNKPNKSCSSLHNFFHKLKDSHNINYLLFICKKRDKSEPTRIN